MFIASNLLNIIASEASKKNASEASKKNASEASSQKIFVLNQNVNEYIRLIYKSNVCIRKKL